MSYFINVIPLFYISSVEIYVMATIVATAVVALCVRPSSRGRAHEYLLSGVLCQFCGESADDSPEAKEPGISFECLDNGNVLLTRYGLQGLTDADAVSLAVTVIGFDVMIEERIHRGSAPGEPIDTALFTLEFLGRERYHIRYNSEPTSMATSLSLSNRDGLHADRILKVNS